MDKISKHIHCLRVCSFVLLSILLSGCSKRYQDLPAFSSWPIQDSHNNSVGRFKTSYLAEQIHAYFRGNAAGPIAVTTFVDIDNLYNTSTFGRLIAEQLMSELAMLGYNVIEVRQSEAMQIMDNEGEFGLSREVELLKGAQDIAGLVVGTYVASPERVYLNARLIDPASSLIISAGSVEMGKTPEIQRMLRANYFPAAVERIPVRQIGWNVRPNPYFWPYGSGQDSRNAPRRFNSEDIYDESNAATNNIPSQATPTPPAPRLETGS